MPENMNLSINGQSQVPPGFRFHPTEEELLHYYLRKKVAFEKIDLDVIREVDLNKLEPWDIQEKCKIGSTPQNDWYFFSHKDKKYPTGTRTNRATAAGFWKATGRDKIIYSGFHRIGLRKTLVFYKGRAPHGQKSDWIMHEYRLDDSPHDTTIVSSSSTAMGDAIAEEGWVVCRVFRKKNYQKTLESPKGSSSSSLMDPKTTRILSSGNDGVLDQILLYMGRTCKMENDSSFANMNNNLSSNEITTSDLRFLSSDGGTGMMIASTHEGLNERFMHLPRLDSPTSLPSPVVPISSPSFDQDRSFRSCYQSPPYDEILTENNEPSSTNANQGSSSTSTGMMMNDWVAFDRLVASQLNGQAVEDNNNNNNNTNNNNANSSTGFGLSPDDDMQLSHILSSQRSSNHRHQQEASSSSHVYAVNENDIWSSFTKSASSPSSSSDPLCHLSV